ncbi:MAG: glycosyltransferase family 2 protein [Crocinitomicaceae bacterium]|nr:glycosyltransferase family 2 protein [Crocinitomicaceae bacterium]
MKDVSVVILNWNGRNYLEKFLPSVVANSGDAQIVVADNASTDDSVAFLKQNYPSVKIIVNQENGGFAKGYNDALKQVKSKYYLLLNSDIEVAPNWLNPLVELVESNESIAGCQPKILSYHDKSKFEHAGACGGYMDHNFFPFCRGRLFDNVETDNGQYDGTTEIFWTSGAALFIRSEVFHQLGGFDESFFAHMEEIDLCWRAKKLGYSFYVQPQSVVYHVGGGTLSYVSPRKTYLNFRNNLYMLVKNYEGLLFPKLFYRMCLDGIAGVRFFFKGEFQNVTAVIKAHFSMYGNLSKLLKKRSEIKSLTTKSNTVGMYKASILWAYYFKGVKEFSKLNQRLFSAN